MEEKKINKKMVFSVVAIIFMILIVAGATYAFFSAQESTDVQTITVGDLGLSFDDSTDIVNATGIVPISDSNITTKAVKKSFGITNTGDDTQYVSLYLDEVIIDDELKSIDFKWALYENDEKIINGDFNSITSKTLLKNNLVFDKGETRNFVLYIWIKETNEAQNQMQGKTLTARITAEAFAQKTNEYNTLTNIFNKDTVTPSYIVSYKNGKLQAAADNYEVSDFIEVKGNTYYAVGYLTPEGITYVNQPHRAYYDENQVYISGENVANNSYVIKTPANAKYMRINMTTKVTPSSLGITLDSPSNYMVVVEGKTLPTKYIGYAESQNNLKTWYETKTALAYGDSIARGEAWYQPVIGQLSLETIINSGVGGRRISGSVGMNQDSNIEALSSDADIIFVIGGTNDWANNVELGATDSEDVLTFNGALNVMIPKLKTKYPNKMIVLLTTTYGEMPDREAFTNKEGILNNLNLSTVDYGNAIKAMAEKHNVSYIDLSTLWTTDTLSTYTSDGIHPNQAGGMLMADEIIEQLKLIEPDN